MEEELDLSKFFLKERYGKDNRALLKCKTCGHCFSETRGTPFFGLNTSIDEVLLGHPATALAQFAEDSCDG